MQSSRPRPPAASAGDVPAFLAHALEADVVILDQHLDWDDDPCLGSVCLAVEVPVRGNSCALPIRMMVKAQNR